MTDIPSQPKKNKLHNIYRLVVMNDETFAEIVSYRLTRLNVYLLLSSVAVVFATIVTMIIFYTPIRQYVPGYGDYNMKSDIQTLYAAVDSIERAAHASDVYAQSLKMHLIDDVKELDTEDNHKLDTSGQNYNDFSPASIPMENDSLRNLIEQVKAGQSAFDLKVSNVGNMFDPNGTNFTTPLVPGSKVTAPFDPKNGHYGIDLADQAGTAVKAVLSGTVIQASWTFETGYVIAVMHKNNFVSFYKHNSKLLKKTGNFVRAGEPLALIGNSGENTNGPHLHFELWYNTQPVNPQDYIKF